MAGSPAHAAANVLSNGLYGRVEDVVSMEHEVFALVAMFVYQRISGLVGLEARYLISDNK